MPNERVREFLSRDRAPEPGTAMNLARLWGRGGCGASESIIDRNAVQDSHAHALRRLCEIMAMDVGAAR